MPASAPGSPSHPHVSVTIPVHNGGAHLEETLASLSRQSYEDFEIVVVDDASSDRSWEILEAAASREPRLRLLRLPSNQGTRAASNAAYRLAHGEIVVRSDQDDVSFPERLARQVEFLHRHKDVGLVGSAYFRELADGSRSLRRPATDHTSLRWRLLFDLPFPHSSFAFRRETLFSTPGPYRFAPAAYDYEIAARIARRTRIATLPDPLVVYRIHDRGLATTASSAMLGSAAAISAREIRRLLAPRRLERPQLEALRKLGRGDATGAEAWEKLPLFADLFGAFEELPDTEPETIRRLRRRWVRRFLTGRTLGELALLARQGLLSVPYRLDPGQTLLTLAAAPLRRTARQLRGCNRQ
jgi:glycosyltransferase involved in cell wall biosynthesis